MHFGELLESITYLCKNSADFLRIQKDNLTDRIDRVIMADERDHTSEGVVLARKHEVIGFPP